LADEAKTGHRDLIISFEFDTLLTKLDQKQKYADFAGQKWDVRRWLVKSFLPHQQKPDWNYLLIFIAFQISIGSTKHFTIAL
jgi:hypothetical protein